MIYVSLDLSTSLWNTYRHNNIIIAFIIISTDEFLIIFEEECWSTNYSTEVKDVPYYFDQGRIFTVK